MKKQGQDDSVSFGNVNNKKNHSISWKIVLGIIVLVLLVIYLAVAIFFRGKFLPGTEVSGMDVSGKTVAQVTQIFDDRADDYSLTIKERNGVEETLTSNQINAQFAGGEDIQEMREEQNALLWIKGLFTKQEFNEGEVLTYNKESFKEAYDNLDCFNKKKIVPIINARPVFKDGKFVIQKEQEGTVLKKKLTDNKIDAAIRSGIASIDLDEAGCYKKPKYTSKSKKIIDLTKKMNDEVTGSITYKFGDQNVVLDASVYSKWFDINKDYTNFTVDENKLENWLLKFMYKYNTQYGTHTFRTHDGRTKKIYGGPYGWRISKDKETASIKKMLEEGTTETRQPYWRSKAKVYDGVNGDIGDTYVEVDLSEQKVFYYKNGKRKFSTDCVTGMMSGDRKTPETVAYIMYKQRKATLNGQGYSSPVEYWMPFIGNVGFHSAPWRSSFGGSQYINGGSHGCVNLPTSSARKLYSLAKEGDPVVTYY